MMEFLVPILIISTIVIINFIAYAFWVIMLIRCAKYEKDNEKVKWLLIIILLYVWGALIYMIKTKLSK